MKKMCNIGNLFGAAGIQKVEPVEELGGVLTRKFFYIKQLQWIKSLLAGAESGDSVTNCRKCL